MAHGSVSLAGSSARKHARTRWYYWHWSTDFQTMHSRFWADGMAAGLSPRHIEKIKLTWAIDMPGISWAVPFPIGGLLILPVANAIEAANRALNSIDATSAERMIVGGIR